MKTLFLWRYRLRLLLDFCPQRCSASFAETVIFSVNCLERSDWIFVVQHEDFMIFLFFVFVYFNTQCAWWQHFNLTVLSQSWWPWDNLKSKTTGCISSAIFFPIMFQFVWLVHTWTRSSTKYFLCLWGVFKGDNLDISGQGTNLNIEFSSENIFSGILHGDNLQWAFHLSDRDQTWRSQQSERWKLMLSLFY